MASTYLWYTWREISRDQKWLMKTKSVNMTTILKDIVIFCAYSVAYWFIITSDDLFYISYRMHSLPTQLHQMELIGKSFTTLKQPKDLKIKLMTWNICLSNLVQIYKSHVYGKRKPGRDIEIQNKCNTINLMDMMNNTIVMFSRQCIHVLFECQPKWKANQLVKIASLQETLLGIFIKALERLSYW